MISAHNSMVSRKRAHYGLCAHPPVLQLFPAEGKIYLKGYPQALQMCNSTVLQSLSTQVH